MLINLRNALMAGKRLPYDAEVEYLEFTGTQHIDSGINYFPDFDIDVLIPSGVSNVTLYSDTQHLLERKNASQPYWVVTAPESLLSSVPIAGRHRVVFRNSVLTIDNTTIGTVGNRTSGSDTCLIFRRKGGAAYNGTLYSLKMWDSNGVLVRDYIPVRVGTVGYLYDRASGRLFGNAGTGDFVLGPDVVPVEYIQSDGNAYLDTGVVPAPNLDYSVTFSAQSALTYYRIFGAWASSNQKRYGAIINAQNVLYQQMTPHGEVLSAYTSPNIMTAEKRGLDCYVNGSKAGSFTSDIEANEVPYSIHVLGINTSGSAIAASAGERVYAFSLTSNSVAVRSMLPVRVGQEGAMIDTLTRRIYRNAGTGAFTYGNDLKYPIPAS